MTWPVKIASLQF